MTQVRTEEESRVLPAGDAEAVRHLLEAIASGKHWYIALLEAIGLWRSREETWQGRTWQYLIAGEAFDWLLLAQRLCEAVDMPLDDERTALLFNGTPPVEVPPQRFKELIGSRKHSLYLNYFYGVTVEEAVFLAVQDEVRKERCIWGWNGERSADDEVYRRVYGASQSELLCQFRQEKGYAQTESIGLTELKEFTYWLFNFRLKSCEKAKVASDTKKGLDWLKSHRVPAMVG